jgi:NAD+ kinase
VKRAGSRPPRVLVIYKKSSYQIYVSERRHEHIRALIDARDATVKNLLRSHAHHVQTVEATRRVLVDLGVRSSFRHRSGPVDTRLADLVVTLGGDGTLLWASHLVGKDVPVLAINTAPKDSVGFFCAGDRSHLQDVLSDAVAGKLRATELARMRVDVDGETLSARVLNDVLFAHECPASTSRYAIKAGSVSELHKSSGLWVGPAAGSTAAQRSAGGRVLPLRSRSLQFVVREPYDPQPGKYRLAKGLVRAGQSLRVESHMRAGRLFIDGPRDVRHVQMAAVLTMRLSDEPLTLLGFRSERRPTR